MNDPINETAIRNAINDWVLLASGLPQTHIWWEGQGQPSKSTTYVSMRLTDMPTEGTDWNVLQAVPEEDAVPGADLEFLLRGTRTWMLTLQCFNGDALGGGSNAAILRRITTSVGLQSIQRILNAGGVGVGAVSAIHPVDGTMSGLFDPRSVVDLKLFIKSELSELGTSIERVNVTNLMTGRLFSVPSIGSWSSGFSSGFGA